MNKKKLYLQGILLLSIVMTLVSCGTIKDNQKITKTPSEKGGRHWSYEGTTSPDYWVELGSVDCGGKNQSPINIVDSNVEKETNHQLSIDDFHYSKKTKIYSVVNNGHSVQYNFKKGDYLTYKGEKYELNQFHFHAPSEHLINGVRYPLEVHMVHLTEDKKILVLSFMIKEGLENEDFSKLETFLPIRKGEKKIADFNYDFLSYLKKDFKYYHYKGSLTTPPCTEGVDWFVLQTPIVLSEGQVSLMQQSMPRNNYRPAQNRNSRIITTN